jgi:hypothetical protein
MIQSYNSDTLAKTAAYNLKEIIMTTDKLAGILYEAYCKAVGGVAFNNDPLPSWKDFRADASKKKQSDGWIAVAEKALSILQD